MTEKLKKTKEKLNSKLKKPLRSNKKSDSNLSLYANLAHQRRSKKDAAARKRAEYLASLPKNPVKRFFYRLHPKRVFKFIFSKRGLFFFLKFAAISVILLVLLVGGLFLYYQKDLNQIRPSELSKRVQTTVSKYYDRNGELLWEDKGTGDYKLVVEGSEISDWAKKATVAIEDREFYKHKGIDLTAILRATINNFKGGATQGGSTLTQQLVKQVFFADEAAERGLKGIPRKIKEMILAIEVERMYSKDQIIALYLNESPYGGRRNGIESGAQTYFKKSAKDLTLAEAALLAAIPNNPAVYNPYNTQFNKSLIERQHKVLDDMVDMGYATRAQADEAKKVAILDSIQPETDQYKDIKAPHFVLEVKKKLEEEFGVKVIRAGGLTVKTTLDSKAQSFAESAVASGAGTLYLTGADNIALTSVDLATGQVIAQVGSVDYHKAGYGQTNAATSTLDPGSSIKPIVDYAPLFNKQDAVYTPGTILRDENIDRLYCGGNSSQCQLRNFTGRFYGDVTIRQSLGNSLNIAAVKSLAIVGPKEGIATARELGDVSYCAGNAEAGLSAAIGGGCSVRQDEHTNAFASLGRGGVYKPVSYILEVKNSSGEKLKEWKDSPKQAIDPQAAYMVSDILSDANARSMVFGAQARSFGFAIPNVWTAAKTGTTDDSKGRAKDSWMMSYSSAVATGVWSGNHDGSALRTSRNDTVRRVMHDYMTAVHHNLYAANGKWKAGDKVVRPSGIQNCSIGGRNDICPSWWSKAKSNYNSIEMEFDSVSKKKATECTPESTRVKITVAEITDPLTKKKTLSAPDGYDPNAEDDVHSCSDSKPQVSSVSYSRHGSSNSYRISGQVIRGKSNIKTITIKVDGSVVATPSSSEFSVDFNFSSSSQKVLIEVTDELGYTESKTYPGPADVTP
ncbi:MAG: transglycosylase domain-containing protein [bacterium]|nr:transglycosylase domain-containing protein [bacterium]